MSHSTRIVYLEDLEGPTATSAANKGGSEPSEQNAVAASATASVAVESASAAAAAAPKASLKRQLTLQDMFASSAKPAESSQKKRKLDNTGSSSEPYKAQSLNAIPFSLTQFTGSLSDDERRLLALECATIGKSWLKVLKDEIRKPYFIKLKRFLWDEGVQGPQDAPKDLKVFPAPNDIYSWSNLTPLGRVKVVIVGQDPYHGPNQAHGLSFSVRRGVPIPPSLRNIYKEIQQEYPEFKPPAHGDLTAWAQNGVLLLNAALTVRAGKANSHSKHGWEAFTEKVIAVVDKYGGANLPGRGGLLAGRGRGIVFLAWGAGAAARVATLDKTKHLILTSAHPSPLSAHRGFLGNGHFKQANEWLEQKYGAEGTVDWCAL